MRVVLNSFVLRSDTSHYSFPSVCILFLSTFCSASHCRLYKEFRKHDPSPTTYYYTENSETRPFSYYLPLYRKSRNMALLLLLTIIQKIQKHGLSPTTYYYTENSETSPFSYCLPLYRKFRNTALLLLLTIIQKIQKHGPSPNTYH